MKTTKTITLLALASALLLAACNQQELERLQTENTTLSTENTQQDSLLLSYLDFVNEIDDNLTLIRQKEELLEEQDLLDPEFKKDKRDEILRDIQIINTLMEENRIKVAHLQKALNQSGDKLHQVQKLANNLQKRIEERDETIIELKEEVKNYFADVVKLEEEVSMLDEQLASRTMTLSLKEELIDSQLATISFQQMELRKAWVATGTFKDLADKEIVTREGGLLGIGAVERLSSSPDQQAFEQVDISKTQLIPIAAKKIQLVTNHPNDSYHLHKEDNGKGIASLEITDPERFWQQSKYLVVLKN